MAVMLTCYLKSGSGQVFANGHLWPRFSAALPPVSFGPTSKSFTMPDRSGKHFLSPSRRMNPKYLRRALVVYSALLALSLFLTILMTILNHHAQGNSPNGSGGWEGSV